MGRYKTTDISIENTRTKKYRNILHTLATISIEKFERHPTTTTTTHIETYNDGRKYRNVKSTLQGGMIIVYSSGELIIARYIYKMSDGREYYGYIKYDEYLSLVRDANISNIMDEESPILNKFKEKEKLSIPFEVKAGDVLYHLNPWYWGKIVVVKTMPRTFTFTDDSQFGGVVYTARIRKCPDGSRWECEGYEIRKNKLKINRNIP